MRRQLSFALTWLRRRRAGVALIVALTAPMLIAMTGLSVGVGTWYQQQQSLQNAADAAATAAGLNDATFGQTTAGAKASAATAIALAAADAATNRQFNFAGGQNGAAIALTAAVPSATLTTYTATATIPRVSAFTRMAPGLFGIGSGVQNATATVELKAAATSPACILATDTAAQQAIYATGGAHLTASNCSITANSNACDANNGDADAIAVDPSAQVVATGVNAPGGRPCIYANTNGQAYVGGPNGDTSVIGAGSETDPLAAMGNPPPWPLMPNTPVAPANANYQPAPSLGYNNNPPTAQGYCGGNYSANCQLYSGGFTGLNNVQVNTLLLNAANNTGTTYVSGGLTIAGNNGITFNGNLYDIAGGMSLTTSGTGALAAGNYNVLGGTTLTNGGYTIGAGTSYFSGAAAASGAATTWGMNLNTPSLSVGAGTYYFNGGLYIAGSNPNVTLGQGLYLFSSNSGNSGGAFDDTNTTSMTFTGGTYFFDGGLTIGGNATVTFGPGIYYVRNGNLTFSNGSHVTANGATFVLEGNASYQMDGGSVALNLTAPSSNCVAPAAYPQAATTLPSSSTTLPNSYAPYDGTNGQGICGIIVYQQRGDAVADGIVEGATSTVTGIFYAPSAALAVSGGASISPATSGNNPGTLAFIQDTFALSGSGSINVSLAANSILNTGGTGGARQVLLIQ